MPLPSDLRAERMDGHTDSDWIVTGMVGGQRIEVARVPFKGPDYDHAALAVVMAAGERMRVALQECQRALADLTAPVMHGIVSSQVMWTRCVEAETRARAAIQSATTILTTDEGGR